MLTRLLTRRQILAALPALALAPGAKAREHLPQSVTFKGTEKFARIVAAARRGNWRALPMGKRVEMFARQMKGTPYVGFTLEIDDRIESPSVNFNGLDCWTFFEIALGLARMIEVPKEQYSPSDLLREIECTRYRGGVCRGNYLDRIHYLAEWYVDNDARDNIDDVTKRVGAAQRMTGRKIHEMTVVWKSYRYLRHDPSLLAGMRQHELRIEQYPFYYIAKDKARAAEAKIQTGDIIGIVTKHDGVFCSHVGLAIRTDDGVCRFMHASKNYKKVVIDKSISGYLNDFSSHAGIIVARPLPRS
jgi:Protein of unknown function (DUF1460)